MHSGSPRVPEGLPRFVPLLSDVGPGRVEDHRNGTPRVSGPCSEDQNTDDVRPVFLRHGTFRDPPASSVQIPPTQNKERPDGVWSETRPVVLPYLSESGTSSVVPQ